MRELAPPKSDKTPSIQTSAERKPTHLSTSGEKAQLATSYEDMLALDFRDPQKTPKENRSPISSKHTAEKQHRSDQSAAVRGPLQNIQNIDNHQSTKKTDKSSIYSSTKTLCSPADSKPQAANPQLDRSTRDQSCMTEVTAAEIDQKFRDFSCFAELFKVACHQQSLEAQSQAQAVLSLLGLINREKAGS